MTYIIMVFAVFAAKNQANKEALDLLAQMEGYRETPYNDCGVYRIGYGTAANGRKCISRPQAWREMAETYRVHFAAVQAAYPRLTRRQAEGFALMRYNTGSFGPRLRRHLARGDVQTALQVAGLYVNSQGKELPGLVERRQKERHFITNK